MTDQLKIGRICVEMQAQDDDASRETLSRSRERRCCVLDASERRPIET